MTWPQSWTWVMKKSIMDKRSELWDWLKVEPWSGSKTMTLLNLRRCRRMRKSTDFSSSSNNWNINTCTTKITFYLFPLAGSLSWSFCWYWVWFTFSRIITYNLKHHRGLDCSKSPSSDFKFEDTFRSTSFHLMGWAPTSIICIFQTKRTQ